MPLSIADFAAKVKAKYPQYAGMDDSELTRRIVEKHPEYRDQVALDVRSQIAERRENPQETAMGDPRAVKETALETYAPFLAHPLNTAKGFGSTVVGGVQSLAHPIDTLKSDMDARGAALDRVKERGIGSDDPENLRDMAEYVLPLVGPAFAQAGRQMNSTNPHERAQGTGAAIAITSGPELVKSFAGDAAGLLPTDETAIAQYQKVIDPKNQNPAVAREMAERLVKNRQVLTDPRTQLTDIQEQRAKAADSNINTAIQNMQQPIDLAAVNNNIEAQKSGLAQPYGPDTAATLRKLDQYQKQVVPMNAIGDVATGRDVIQPTTARDLRIEFDKAPYGKQSTTADAAARKAVGDSLRAELNADPSVKAANEAFQREKAGKDLAEDIPAHKPYNANAGALLAKAAATTAATALGGPVAGKIVGALVGGSELAKYVKSVVQSPGYKTWSAIKKQQFAEAVAAKDVAKIGAVAGSASPFGIKENRNR